MCRAVLLVLFGAAVYCLAEESQACANVFCGAGRECAVTEKGEALCTCVEHCKAHKRPVCGSNGRTYRNHCELHRHACLTHTKIHLQQDGHCLEKLDQAAASPIVCYAEDRNELRSRVIGWLQWEEEPDGWFSTGNNFSQILQKYFKEYDDGDSQLDSSEFLTLLQHNETASNITAYASKDNNLLLRSLCVDALIELSDENADWKLSFDEFLNCLKPNFSPPDRECALEDETFEDGAETHMECNRCVCACGNWVCTAVTCDRADQLAEEEAEGAELEMTEEEWTRRVAELNKHQETVEMMRGVTKEI